jgi:hypothetical protein
MYVLQSENERKAFRVAEKGRTGRIDRRMKRLDDEALILQKMYFNPVNFALTKLLIIDRTDNRKMEMEFDEFVKVDNKDYPGFISMNFYSEEQEVSLKINLNGFSTEKLGPINFAIPEKYKKIKVN